MATTANIATKETVFDPLNHTRLVKDLTVGGRAVLKQQLQFTSLRFFTTAAVSMFEFWLYKVGLPAMAYTALATAVAMGVAGVFALRLNRTAFFGAVVAYSLATALLLGEAAQGHCSMLLGQPMLIHAVILRAMWQAYGKMDELHTMESL
jgi:hypothetical protein